MPNLTAPIDGRRQYSFADMAVAHAISGVPLSRFEQVSPTAYVVKNSWPQPPTTNRWDGGGFSGLAASQAVPEEAPRSSAGALALWPNLK